MCLVAIVSSTDIRYFKVKVLSKSLLGVAGLCNVPAERTYLGIESVRQIGCFGTGNSEIIVDAKKSFKSFTIIPGGLCFVTNVPTKALIH
jgi:hypothetical protein